jgi:hypothetical protein
MPLSRYNHCPASQRHYNDFAGAARPDAENRLPCPVCGKTVKLRPDVGAMRVNKPITVIPTHTPARSTS